MDELEEIVLVADDSGAYVAASNVALELLGYERKELLGKHIWDVTPADNVADAQQRFDSFKGHQAQRGDFVLKTKRGGLIPVKYEAYSAVRLGLHMVILQPEPKVAA